MNAPFEVISFTIERIKELSNSIKNTASRVKANKHQCKSLADRIIRINSILNVNVQMKKIHPPLYNALENFRLYLTQCDIFVKKFEKDGWFIRIKNNRNYNREFKRFNEELCHHCQDLQLSIALHELFQPARDEHDAQQDLIEVEQIIIRTKLLKPSVLSNEPQKLSTVPKSFPQSPTVVRTGTNPSSIHTPAIIKTPQVQRPTGPSSTNNLRPPLSHDQLKRHHHYQLKI